MAGLRPCKYADKGFSNTMTWELRLVENMGDIYGSLDSKEVVVPTEPLITDMEKQLKFLPTNFTWTVGWRTYVWQETETKEFKQLSDSEYKELLSGGTLNYTGDDSGSDTGSGTTGSDEGSTAQ